MTNQTAVTASNIEPVAPSPKQCLKVLILELTLQKRHQQVVKDQNAALIACDRLRFMALQETYQLLLGELEVQHKLRSGLLGMARIENLIATWPDTDRNAAQRVPNELKTVLLDVRRVNEQNKKLIANQIKYIDFMVTVLVNTHRKGCFYGPQGMQSINRGNVFFNGAA
jgi:flagellar biosynthesis/type III secretory pathway chaperone